MGGPGSVTVRDVRRTAAVAIVAGLALGATALAAAQGGENPYDRPEPDVSSGQVLRLPGAAGGCSASRTVTVRVNPPTGAVLGFVRIEVDGRRAARLTGVPRAASATVRVPQSGARVTATAETLGGQRLRASRVYSDCTRPPADTPAPVGGGEG